MKNFFILHTHAFIQFQFLSRLIVTNDNNLIFKQRSILQANSVITNSTGPSVFVCYNREFIITVKIYVVK